jgi:hypothetical protein
MVIINGCFGEFFPAYRHTSQTSVRQYFCSGSGGAVIEGREKYESYLLFALKRI